MQRSPRRLLLAPLVVLALVVAVLLTGLGLSAAAQAQPLVLAPAEAPPPSVRLHPERSTSEVGARPGSEPAPVPAPSYARLDAGVLEAAVAAAERDGRAEIALAVGGQRVRSAAVWVERRGPGRLTWSGSVAGDPLGHVLLTVEGGAAVGRVTAGGRTYGVGYAGGGRQAVYAVAAREGASYCKAETPSGAAGARVPGPGGLELEELKRADERGRGGGSAGAVDTVRVLLVYTAAVREALGAEGLAAFLQGLTDSANDVLARTEVAGRLRLGAALEVPTPDPEEVPDASAALDRLRRRHDGVLDEVHAWRLEHESALVSLVTEASGYCGLAYVPAQVRILNVRKFGFSVVQRGCAIGNHAFAHEVGHNLGLRHDPYVDSRDYPFPYAKGYVDLAPGANEPFRTVMAYADACREAGAECPVVPYFSNPALSLGGDALGEAGVSDAARALAISVPIGAQAGTPSLPTAPDFEVTIAEDGEYRVRPDPSAYLSHISAPEHGEAREQNDQLVYRPDPHYHGADSLTYEVTNEHGFSATGTVRLEIVPVVDAPLPATILAPEPGYTIDLNEATGPLEVRWSELVHPDYPEGGAPLSVTWQLLGTHGQALLEEVAAGDGTEVSLPLSLLDNAMENLGWGPGRFGRAYHRVVVSDGERSTTGPGQRLFIKRYGVGEDEDSEGEDEPGAESFPRVVELRAAYPNPAREALTLELGVPRPTSARLTLYDVTGRPVLVERASLREGYNEVRLGVGRLPVGLYLYRVEAGGATFRGRVVVL